MYSKVTCSLLFLHGLQGHYKNLGTSYISMILAYQQEYSEAAQLPHHLRTLALAQTLAEANYGGMACDIAMHSQASRVSAGTTPGDRSGNDFSIHTQGFVAMKAELQGNCNGNMRGPGGPPHAALNAALPNHRCSAAPR
jgi:hypothetical protein